MRRACPFRLLSATGALAVVAAAFFSTAAEAECAMGQPPLVVNVIPFDTPIAEQSVSRRRIAELDKQPASKGYVDQGMTQANLESEMSASLKIAKTENGVCAAPTEVNVRIGYSEMMVFLDKRYAKGSCEYSAIRRHEYQHVGLFRDILRSRLPEIRAALLRDGRSGRFRVRAVDSQTVRRSLMERLDATLHTVIDDINRDINRRQDALDTRASYAAVHASCSRW